MTTDKSQANTNSVTGIITVFGELARVLFDFGASRSFISSSFALHADQKLTSERLNRGKFQKKRVLAFYPGNLRKKEKVQNSQSIHLDWVLN